MLTAARRYLLGGRVVWARASQRAEVPGHPVHVAQERAGRALPMPALVHGRGQGLLQSYRLSPSRTLRFSSSAALSCLGTGSHCVISGSRSDSMPSSSRSFLCHQALPRSPVLVINALVSLRMASTKRRSLASRSFNKRSRSSAAASRFSTLAMRRFASNPRWLFNNFAASARSRSASVKFTSAPSVSSLALDVALRTMPSALSAASFRTASARFSFVSALCLRPAVRLPRINPCGSPTRSHASSCNRDAASFFASLPHRPLTSRPVVNASAAIDAAVIPSRSSPSAVLPRGKLKAWTWN